MTQISRLLNPTQRTIKNHFHSDFGHQKKCLGSQIVGCALWEVPDGARTRSAMVNGKNIHLSIPDLSIKTE